MIQPPPLPIDKTAPWRALAAHASAVRQRHLRDLFAADAGRFTRFSFRCGDLLPDLSRQRLEDETLRLLLELAGEADVLRWRDRMLAGEKTNQIGRVNGWTPVNNENIENRYQLVKK